MIWYSLFKLPIAESQFYQGQVLSTVEHENIIQHFSFSKKPVHLKSK